MIMTIINLETKLSHKSSFRIFGCNNPHSEMY